MLSAFVAAMALVSCNKETHTPEDSSLKTVEISLKNIIMTKGPAGDPIKAGEDGKMPAVQVSNFQVFLTDDTYTSTYDAWDADGSKKLSFYFDKAEDLKEKLQFHYVDHKCTKVVVVANMGEGMTLDKVMDIDKSIDEQQNQTNLILYGESGLKFTNDQHTNETTGEITDIYEAKVALVPTISRFEVDGFRVDFNEPSTFSSVAVTDIAFQHYYPHLAVSYSNGLDIYGDGKYDDHLTMDDLQKNEAKVHQWFNESNKGVWFRDNFSPALTMTPASPTAKPKNALAYHFYAGAVVPTMIIKLLADNTPAYVYTNTYKTSANATLTEIMPGKIYRMSVNGANDGIVEIPENKITPINRCIEVSIEVEDWVVELITPEF